MSEFIDMICPKCEGTGKQDKKTECDLCSGWCWVSLEVYEEYKRQEKSEAEE